MKKNNFKKIFSSLILLTLLTSCSGTIHQKEYIPCDDLVVPNNSNYQRLQKGGYEVPPVLDSATILPPRMKQSPIYTVEKDVYSDGYYDHFTIRSPYGTFYAGGVYQLKIRLNELIAIDALKKTSSLGATFDGILGGIGDLAMAPFNAVGAITSVFTSDDKEEEITESVSEPAPIDFTKQNVKPKKIDYDNSRVGKLLAMGKKYYRSVPAPKVESESEGVIGGLLGYSDKVIEIQKKFNIDPYSDNEVLRSEIQRVASAQTGGKMTTSISSSSATVLSALNTANSAANLINSISIYADEKKQKEMIQKELKAAGVTDELYQRFDNAPGLSLLFKTQITNVLMQLKGVNNRDELIKLASYVEDYELGQSILQMYATLPRLYKQVKFVRFIEDVPMITAVTKDGKAYISLASDHLYWTDSLEILLDITLNGIIEDGGIHTVEMQITGKTSPRVITELQKRGIRVVVLEDPEKYSLR